MTNGIQKFVEIDNPLLPIKLRHLRINIKVELFIHNSKSS